MQEVKIWEIVSSSEAVPLEARDKVDTEKLLEDTLVNNPEMLIPELKLVGRQTPTEGGPLDLLGVDGDGRLVVFELKRGILSRDAVAQIIDYASYLNSMGSSAISRHIADRSGENGIEEIEDFQQWYSDLGFDESDNLLPPRLFLVGLGADDKTQRMVDFLANTSSMDISLLSFYSFQHDDKTLVAKQVDVSGIPIPAERNKPTREEKWAALSNKARANGIGDLYGGVKMMFDENWFSPKQRPGSSYFSVKLRPNANRNRHPVNFAEVYPETNKIRIAYLRRAIDLCNNAFEIAVNDIPLQTWPRNKLPMDPTTKKIEFLLTTEDWHIHKDRLTQLTKTIYEAWQKSASVVSSESE